METDLDGETVARRAMAIAADICVYTNHNIITDFHCSNEIKLYAFVMWLQLTKLAR